MIAHFLHKLVKSSLEFSCVSFHKVLALNGFVLTPIKYLVLPGNNDVRTISRGSFSSPMMKSSRKDFPMSPVAYHEISGRLSHTKVDWDSNLALYSY